MMLDPTDILKTVNYFRRGIPVDVEGLAMALGIKVRYADLGSEVSGMIEKNPNEDGYIISVNKDDPETRKRFTIAHELGHYILHLDKIGNGIEDNRIYSSINTGKYKNLNIGEYEENQANQIAVNILMPLESIKKIQAEGQNDLGKVADILKVSKRSLEIRMSDFSKD